MYMLTYSKTFKEISNVKTESSTNQQQEQNFPWEVCAKFCVVPLYEKEMPMDFPKP